MNRSPCNQHKNYGDILQLFQNVKSSNSGVYLTHSTSPFGLTTFQVPEGHLRLMVTVLDRADL